MGFRGKDTRLIKEYLRTEGPKSVLEIKDHLNEGRSKYGTTAGQLRSFLIKHKQEFEKVGQTSVERPTGRYLVDKWHIRKELKQAITIDNTPATNNNSQQQILFNITKKM